MKKIFLFPLFLFFIYGSSFFSMLLIFQSCDKNEPLIGQDPFGDSEIPREILYEVKDWYDEKMNNYEVSDSIYGLRFLAWSASSINYIEEGKYWVLSVPLFDKSIIYTKKKMKVVVYKTSLGLKGFIVEDISREVSRANKELTNETNIYTIWGKFINSTRRQNKEVNIGSELTQNMRLGSGESGGGGCPSWIPQGTICLNEVTIMGSRWVNNISYLWTITPPSYYPNVSYTNSGVNHYQWFNGNSYVSGSGVNINVYNTNQNQVIEITEQMLISILEGTTYDNTTNLLTLISNILSQYNKAFIKGTTIAKVIADRNGQFDLYLEIGKIDKIEKNGNEIKIIFQGKNLKFAVTDFLNVKLDSDNNFIIETMNSNMIYIDINGLSSAFVGINAIKILEDGIYAKIGFVWSKIITF